MVFRRAPDAHQDPHKTASEDSADSPQADPLSQSPDDPIEFTRGDDVARGNMERANAEPEPPALHDAEVPGKPDTVERRHDEAKRHDD